MDIIKGRNVALWIDGEVIVGSTDCEFSVKANTADTTSKTDPGNGMWDNPEFVNYDFSCSNQSFLCDTSAQLQTLLRAVIEGEKPILVEFAPVGTGGEGDYVWSTIQGEAYITQLTIDATNGEKAKLSLSMEGNGSLTTNTKQKKIVPVPGKTAINGKALMVAVQRDGEWHTYMAATSHSLTINVQTSDASHKDVGIHKEITGKNVTLSTENLFAMDDGGDPNDMSQDVCLAVNSILAGQKVRLKFGYYANATPDAESSNWGEPTVTIIEGDFLTTQVQMTAPTQGHATYKAEFTSSGEITL